MVKRPAPPRPNPPPKPSEGGFFYGLIPPHTESEPPTEPRRIIVGDDPTKRERPAAPDPKPTRHEKGDKPTKRSEMFTQFKLGEYEIGPSFDGIPTIMISMAAILLALLAITIFQDRKNHHPLPSSPPICARGYEI
ncbi:hypothetical protein [Komagataeibacter sp. FNDCR2]|uniref:hypothetical protein n=1 Tax=Komagataeibacter sp. FNDCR2 TaxID=2878682 RepID=UPI001E6471BD|nr:hypothetical protein [Komagataeibacter sp. FNDCR2]MCE2576051.1 hypothetical protein [Komagataeibacter sp. FNDCR2]